MVIMVSKAFSFFFFPFIRSFLKLLVLLGNPKQLTAINSRETAVVVFFFFPYIYTLIYNFPTQDHSYNPDNVVLYKTGN